MTEPKAIWDRVYVVGGAGLSHPADCCVYLVDAFNDILLIDAGAGLGLDRILRNISSLGFEPHQISHIIATHCHIDHIGGIPLLKDLYGCKIIAHKLDREGIEEGDPRTTAANLYGLDYDPRKIDVLLDGNIKTLTIGDLDFCFLHTPGHTPGSISVILDHNGRVLFGQDIHGPFHTGWGSDITLWRRSMKTLLSLNADLLCEGHAGIMRGEEVRLYIEAQHKRYRNE